MSFDAARYRSYFEGSGLSDAEMDERIIQLWLILKSFLDRAIGADPTQICLGLRDQRDSIEASNHVEFEDQLSPIFEGAAAPRQKDDTP